MSSQEVAHIFIDANVALHFKRPDQIDWCALVKSQRVELLAAPILSRELEEQKIHNPSRKLRNRAGDYIKWLVQFVRDPGREVRSGTSWDFIAVEPMIDFPASNLSPSVADDQLIASVLSYEAENASSIYVATADVGLEIKLRSRGLQPLILSEELRLPDEPDPLEQENRSLRRQLAERHTPVLALVTEAPGRHPFTMAPEVTSPSAPTLEQVRREHPHIAPAVEPPAAAQGSTGFERLQAEFLASARSMMHPRIVRYNDERETFLRAYEKYLADLKIWEEQHALTIGVELSVSNAGTAPASDIDVVLLFPDDLILLTKDDLPKRPKAAVPPAPPDSVASLLGAARSPLGLGDYLHRIDMPDLDSTARAGCHEYEVSYWLRNLKHGFTGKLRGVYFRFPDRQAVRSFSVNYQLSATELPIAISGELHFVLT
jgi:hypothetical protein